MKKILIASRNKGKIGEIKKGLKNLEELGIEILTLNDVLVGEDPVESGKDFQENSQIKAKFYSDKTGLPTLSDDAGLVIPFLNNEPGVLSRRWPGYEATDQQLIDFTLLHLRGVKPINRTAYLKTCMCFYDPKADRYIIEEGAIKGKIAETPYPILTPGYPYRVLFIVDKLNKYYEELTHEEHERINHRLKALNKLTKKIESLI